MAGSHDGGLKAAATNRQRYDAKYASEGGFYGHIGRTGGVKSHGGGFSKYPGLASEAGAKGGKASRRRSKKK